MTSRFVIDAVVQQATILVAQLATAKGVRAPLSHVADQVFLELANAIEAQGVSRKVAADMFGLALRSYQLKVQRLEESASARDRSLWEAVYGYIAEQGMVQRAKVLTEFRHDDGASVKSILQDLVDSGLVFQTGSGRGRSYRVASREEVEELALADEQKSLRSVVWVELYRGGPQTVEELAARLSVEVASAKEAVEELRAEGHVTRDGEGRYGCERCYVPRDDMEGWEAAVIDHFQAVVVALTVKLREMAQPTLPAEAVGGSTYSFDVHEEHPYYEEVRSLLSNTRDELSELAAKVKEYNDEHGRNEVDQKVTFYFGQSVVSDT